MKDYKENPSATSANRITRRQSLGRMAAVGAASFFPLVLPSRLFGQNAPSKQVNLLMLGCGRQAYHTNMPTLLAMPEVRIVAVCDVDRNRAAMSKKRVDEAYGNTDCKVFTDYREALEMPGLDAVMNSTTDHWHAITSLAAIRKGLHVSCEKPLTRYLTEGRLVADAAQKSGLVFRTDTECRSNGYMTKLADLAMNGYLGNLTRFEAGVPTDAGVGGGNPAPMPVPAHLDYDMWLGPAPWKEYTLDRVHPVELTDRPGWMQIQDYCEGMISNWGTHLLDVASLVNKSERTGPVSVEATGSSPPAKPGLGLWNVLVNFKVQYKYANGVVMDYFNKTPYLRVEGDEGWLQANWGSAGGFQASDPKLLRIKFKESDTRVPTRGDKADFISAITKGTPVMCDAEIGHRTCSLGQIAHIAVQRGKPLEWNPDTEKFTNDEDANKLLVGTYRENFPLK